LPTPVELSCVLGVPRVLLRGLFVPNDSEQGIWLTCAGDGQIENSLLACTVPLTSHGHQQWPSGGKTYPCAYAVRTQWPPTKTLQDTLAPHGWPPGVATGVRRAGTTCGRRHNAVDGRCEECSMKGFTQDIDAAEHRAANLSPNDDTSWVRCPCAHCGGGQMFLLAQTRNNSDTRRPFVQWLRCVNCLRGVVRNEMIISPETKPLDTPDVLTGEDLAAWDEVRACLSVGANTAAVMMCRKLLFHIAVAHGLADKDEKGWAPNFEQALQHLEDEGVVTKHMRPWVDKIKKVGNDANHEIPCTTSEQAMDVALFTRQLIRLAYELPAMVAQHTAEDSSGD
jgi:hypothetical protein